MTEIIPFDKKRKYKIMTIVYPQTCCQFFCQDTSNQFGIYLSPTEIHFHDILQNTSRGYVYIRSFSRYMDMNQTKIIFRLQSNTCGDLTTQLQITFSINKCDIFVITMDENEYRITYTDKNVVDRIWNNVEYCYQKHKDLLM